MTSSGSWKLFELNSQEMRDLLNIRNGCILCSSFKKIMHSRSYEIDNSVYVDAKTVSSCSSGKVDEHDGLSDEICAICVRQLALELADPAIRKSLELPPDDETSSNAYTISGNFFVVSSDNADPKEDIFVFQASSITVGENIDDIEQPGGLQGNNARPPVECEVCKKVFRFPSALKNHMPTHTGELRHECDICGKAYKTSSSRNIHRRIHSGERPYPCTICTKKFSSSSSLISHKKTHKFDEDKKFFCKVCDKGFALSGYLRKHELLHSGERPHKCNLCDASFVQKNSLKVHLNTHSNLKPFVCKICEKQYTQNGSLIKHMKRHNLRKV